MMLALLALVVGLGLLVWGSDRFVTGAAASARNLGISPLVIGLTVVGVGTSAPEILVSGSAAVWGSPGVAIGNALGSNIANIGLVLGITALVRAIDVRSQTVRRELPIMLAVLLLAWLLLLDGTLNRVDGLILIGAFVGLIGVMVVMALRARRDPLENEFQREIDSDLTMARAVLWSVVGLGALLLGAQSMVWGAVSIATQAGVSEFLIGLTVVAVGTSLPELATCIASTVKGEPDIAVGNVIGSNMFNLLPVLALPAMIAPGAVDPAATARDLPVMLAFTFALFIFCGFKGPGRLARWEGGLLLVAFIGYQGLLYFFAGSSEL